MRREVTDLRAGFTELGYCFSPDAFAKELDLLRARL